jgi:acetyl-CoA carboxylase carboxyl transferase subunit alpha
VGGAHRDWEATAANLREALRTQLATLRASSAAALVADRYEKFRRLGAYEEAATPRA